MITPLYHAHEDCQVIANFVLSLYCERRLQLLCYSRPIACVNSLLGTKSASSAVLHGPGLSPKINARVHLRDRHGIIMPSNPAAWQDLRDRGFERISNPTRGR